LPFLAVNGNFDYWKHPKTGDQRQKHLLAILRALDAVRTSAYDADADAYAYAADADAADYAAYAARTAADAAYAAAYAARTAADAAYAAAYDVRTAAYAADAADAAARGNARSEIDLREILLKDLKIIQTKQTKFQSDIAIYGEIWDNFQSALREVGCEYWGEWYEQVFAKGFMLDDADREEIDLRLSVPREIQARGAAEVARYVFELKKHGVARLNEARVIILGNKGSGKTSLAKRLKDPTAKMPKEDESTEGVDVLDWPVPATPNQPESGVNVHIWDFAGHVITHAVHPCFMSERCLYILVVDGRTEGDGRTEYWLEQIRSYGKNSHVLVLTNIRDKNSVDLPKNTLRKVFPSIAGFYEVNIDVGGKPLEDFQQVVMGHLRNNPLWKNQKISAPAYKVKEALRQKFAQGNNFIKRVDFDQIAKEKDIKPEEQAQLLLDLRDLGICLWYDNAKMDEAHDLVLNPGWISHGIYRLINWGLNQKKNSLSHSDFSRVFMGKDGGRYPAEKADFLFKLMVSYQLAFFKGDDTAEIFVPLLCPIDRLEHGVPELNIGNRLLMKYSANQALPPYTVARLAVQHSSEWDIDRSWRFGAVLCWEDTTALVEMENECAWSITVSVRGPKQTEYISKLRTTLNDIFKGYESNRPELKYEVNFLDAETKRLDSQTLSHKDSNEFLQTEKQIVINAQASQALPQDNPLQMVLKQAIRAAKEYDLPLTIQIIGGDYIANGDKSDDHSTNINNYQTVNVSFHNCSVGLQGELNALALRFSELGTPEDIELAKELAGVASDLDASIKEIPPDVKPDSQEMEKVRTSLQKKGRLSRLGTFYVDLNDENSELYQKTVNLRKGVEILQKIGCGYNDVAQWLCLPQIPRFFLKISEKNT